MLSEGGFCFILRWNVIDFAKPSKWWLSTLLYAGAILGRQKGAGTPGWSGTFSLPERDGEPWQLEMIWRV